MLRSSIIELAVLGALILVFVVSIVLLRRGRSLTEANADEDHSPQSGNERGATQI